MSRYEFYGSNAWICKTPDVGELDYIVDMFNALGQCKSNGYGVSPIDWTELKSYSDLNDCSRWELQIIHAMSVEFVSARNVFSDVNCEPPFLYNDISFRYLSAQAADAKMIANKPSK